MEILLFSDRATGGASPNYSWSIVGDGGRQGSDTLTLAYPLIRYSFVVPHLGSCQPYGPVPVIGFLATDCPVMVLAPSRRCYHQPCCDDPGGTRRNEWQFQHWFRACVTLVILFVTSVCSSKETTDTTYANNGKVER